MEVINGVWNRLLLAALIAIPLSAIIGWGISRNISGPVLTLTRATQQMAAGDLSTRVKLDRVDELGALARTFNAMAGQIERTVSTLKQFVADAAHEIKTPLTAIRTNLELAADRASDPEGQEDLALALHELDRLEKLTSNLLTLARLESKPAAPHAPLDLAALVRQIHERYASRAEQAGVRLEASGLAGPVLIDGDGEQMMRLLDNLLENAVKFTPEGGSVTISLDITPPDTARLCVADTGIGIPEDDLPRLFSRFHRGRNAAAYPGNGLGLVIVKTIVDDHGGAIAVRSAPTGTCFTVELPLSRAQGERT